MKKFLFMTCAVLLVFSFMNISHAQKAGFSVGDKAPVFTLIDTTGNKVSLHNVIKANKATLLVFWATWCSYCREEIPALQALNNTYKNKGLKILAIDMGENQKKVNSFTKQQGITYTVLLDTNSKVANRYNVIGIPTNILLDKGGVIKYRGTRPPPEDLLPK